MKITKKPIKVSNLQQHQRLSLALENPTLKRKRDGTKKLLNLLSETALPFEPNNELIIDME
jgi:hypothetical protein